MKMPKVGIQLQVGGLHLRSLEKFYYEPPKDHVTIRSNFKTGNVNMDVVPLLSTFMSEDGCPFNYSPSWLVRTVPLCQNLKDLFIRHSEQYFKAQNNNNNINNKGQFRNTSWWRNWTILFALCICILQLSLSRNDSTSLFRHVSRFPCRVRELIQAVFYYDGRQLYYCCQGNLVMMFIACLFKSYFIINCRYWLALNPSRWNEYCKSKLSSAVSPLAYLRAPLYLKNDWSVIMGGKIVNKKHLRDKDTKHNDSNDYEGIIRDVDGVDFTVPCFYNYGTNSTEDETDILYIDNAQFNRAFAGQCSFDNLFKKECHLFQCIDFNEMAYYNGESMYNDDLQQAMTDLPQRDNPQYSEKHLMRIGIGKIPAAFRDRFSPVFTPLEQAKTFLTTKNESLLVLSHTSGFNNTYVHIFYNFLQFYAIMYYFLFFF